MVTFITILQVNLVMSILLYVMFLAYLYGISASTMDKQRPTQDPINTLIIKLLQADISRSRQKQDEGVPDARPPATSNIPVATDFEERFSSAIYQPVTDISVELLRQHKRYNSPRVLLSDRPPLQPPPLYLTDDFVSNQDANNKTRQKRYAEHRSYRGEYSVCDSQSQWVMDRTTAMDIRGDQVTIMDNISDGHKYVKQYFYETTCRSTKPYKGGCRGIDDKHWNSECKTTQSYVRALTRLKEYYQCRRQTKGKCTDSGCNLDTFRPRMAHEKRFAQIPMSKRMRDLCKEEDYAFLNRQRDQGWSQEESAFPDSQSQKKPEERDCRQHERELQIQEKQCEIEEQQKEREEKWKSHVAELAVKREAIHARLHRLQKFRDFQKKVLLQDADSADKHSTTS